MRVFVTGASGWIGSAVTAELVAAGHQVVGLARSDASAAAIAAAGADVLRGDVTDGASLREGAAGSDGIIHTAYNHDFSRHNEAAEADFETVKLFGELLEGTGRPLVIASGLVGGPPVETDRLDPASSPSPRARTEQALLGFADRGIRSSAVRLSPSVHGDGDRGFVARLVAIAREKGVSGYVGDGSNVWPAVHRLDAAHLFALALEKAPRRLGTARRGRRGRAFAPHCRGDWRPAQRPPPKCFPGRRRCPLRFPRPHPGHGRPRNEHAHP